MKTFSILCLSLGVALALSACNNEPGAQSTPVDSVNSSGAAPVQYNGSTEASQVDTTLQSHPTEQKARADANANATIGAGTTTPPPSSNTTDSATTSGSANRKR